MTISDNSCESTYNYNESIDRQIYLRLQLIPIHPLGTLVSDSLNPIKDFMDTFNAIQAGTLPTNNANLLLGSLGVTQYYPHRDNTYLGVLG